MGIDSDTTSPGLYFLSTKSSSPYGMGSAGSGWVLSIYIFLYKMSLNSPISKDPWFRMKEKKGEKYCLVKIYSELKAIGKLL